MTNKLRTAQRKNWLSHRAPPPLREATYIISRQQQILWNVDVTEAHPSGVTPDTEVLIVKPVSARRQRHCDVSVDEWRQLFRTFDRRTVSFVHFKCVFRNPEYHFV